MSAAPGGYTVCGNYILSNFSPEGFVGIGEAAGYKIKSAIPKE